MTSGRRNFSVDQDISMSAEAVSRTGWRSDGVSTAADAAGEERSGTE